MPTWLDCGYRPQCGASCVYGAMKCNRGASLTGRAQVRYLLNQTSGNFYKGAHTEGSRQLDDVALARDAKTGRAIKLAARVAAAAYGLKDTWHKVNPEDE